MKNIFLSLTKEVHEEEVPVSGLGIQGVFMSRFYIFIQKNKIYKTYKVPIKDKETVTLIFLGR